MKKLVLAALLCLAAATAFAQDADFYFNRGLQFARQGDMDAAITDWTEAIRLNPKYTEAYYNRGLAYYTKGDLDAAIANYTEAIRLNPNLGAIYNNRGEAYRLKGDLDAAIADYTEAIRLNPDHAYTYNNLGLAYYTKGDLDAAIAVYTEAIRLNPDYAHAYNNRGNIYSGKGDFDAAIADYTEAIRLSPYLAETYNNRGIAYSAKGDPDSAIADFTVAIRLNPNLAEAYNNRGLAYFDKSDMDQAIAEYTKAIQLNQNYAIAYSNRGNAYYKKSDIDLAIVDHTVTIRLNPDIAGAYYNRGNMYYEKGDMDSAVIDYRLSIEVAARSGDMRDIFFCAWEFAGSAYQNSPFLKNIPGGYAVLRAGLAREALAASIARAEQARSALGARGAALTGRVLYQYYAAADLEAVLDSPERAFGYSESLRSRGFLEQLGTEAALRLPGVNAADARRVRELTQDMGNTQELLAKLNPQTDGDRYTEAARRLTALETELAAVEARITGGLSPAEKARYAQLRNPRPVGAEEARSWCPPDTAVLEYILWDDTVDFAAPATSYGQSTYQERPSINSYCLVLTKDGIIPVVLDHDPDYVSLVNYLRQSIIEGLPLSSEAVEERRNILYNALIKPVLARLPASVKNLVIVPDGILGHLPFDILRENASSPDLGQSYRLSFSPSVSVSILAAKTGQRKSTPLLALGGAWYNPEKTAARRGERDLEFGVAAEAPGKTPEQAERATLRWMDLPGTETEVKALQTLVARRDMTLLLGKEVTEEAVKGLSGTGKLAAYPALHFACHGYFNALDAARSGIVFSEVSGLVSTGEDGYLTIPEIVLLNLDARIVVLSACETGLGELKRGDGMVGLARAFMIAGTENVGVSLWSIADEATAEFMTRMYRKVLKEGKTFKEAYYLVKNEFRSDPKWSHPLYWAAFVLYE